MSAIKLTSEQAGMVAECLKNGAAWATASGSGNDALLRGWAYRGWVTPIAPPPNIIGLVAYQFTDAGRAALSSQKEG